MRYFLLLILLPCCALKKERIPPPEISLEVTTITFSWTGDQEYAVRRTLTKSGNDYISTSPITVSSPVPHSLKVESTLPLAGETYIETVAALNRGSAYSLGASFKDGGLQLNGIRSVLPDNKDEQIELALQARNSKTGEHPFRIRFILRTEPTMVGLQVLPRTTNPAALTLKSPNMRLDLLRVITLKNEKEADTFVVPKAHTVKGRIIRKFTEYGLAFHECSHEQFIRDYAEQYETDFFLLPINEKLQSSWLTSIFSAAQFFELPKKSQISLGLYGSGKTLAQFIDNGVPTQNAAQVRVPIRCQRGQCDEGRRGCERETVYGQGLQGVQGKDVQIYLEDDVNKASLGYEVSTDNSPALAFDLLPPTLPLF